MGDTMLRLGRRCEDVVDTSSADGVFFLGEAFCFFVVMVKSGHLLLDWVSRVRKAGMMMRKREGGIVECRK